MFTGVTVYDALTLSTAEDGGIVIEEMKYGIQDIGQMLALEEKSMGSLALIEGCRECLTVQAATI